MPARTFIFGYGSLIGPPGINCRGMARRYSNDDLIEVSIRHHVRELHAGYRHSGVRFFGLRPSVGITTNGVLFEIAREDMSAFIRSEGSGLIYRFDDVTPWINVAPGFLGPRDKVITCMTIKPTDAGKPRKAYLDVCSQCLSYRSEAFRVAFGRVNSY